MSISALATGTLAKVGEIKTSPKGKDYIYFSIAVKGDVIYFISCVAFDDNVNKIASMAKNSAISVKGELKLSEWTAIDGSTKSGLKMSVAELICI